jgi:hypothetical protein
LLCHQVETVRGFRMGPHDAISIGDAVSSCDRTR